MLAESDKIIVVYTSGVASVGKVNGFNDRFSSKLSPKKRQHEERQPQPANTDRPRRNVERCQEQQNERDNDESKYHGGSFGWFI